MSAFIALLSITLGCQVWIWDIFGCWFDIYGYNGHGENEVGRIKIGPEMGLGLMIAFMAGRLAGRRAVWVILHGIEYRPAYLILSETLRLLTISIWASVLLRLLPSPRSYV